MLFSSRREEELYQELFGAIGDRYLTISALLILAVILYFSACLCIARLRRWARKLTTKRADVDVEMRSMSGACRFCHAHSVIPSTRPPSSAANSIGQLPPPSLHGSGDVPIDDGEPPIDNDDGSAGGEEEEGGGMAVN